MFPPGLDVITVGLLFVVAILAFALSFDKNNRPLEAWGMRFLALALVIVTILYYF